MGKASTRMTSLKWLGEYGYHPVWKTISYQTLYNHDITDVINDPIDSGVGKN